MGAIVLSRMSGGRKEYYRVVGDATTNIDEAKHFGSRFVASMVEMEMCREGDHDWAIEEVEL